MQVDWQAVSVIVSVIAVLGSIAGVFIAIKKAPYEIKQTNSSAANAVAQSVSNILEPLNERVDCLEVENAEMKRTINALERTITALEKRIGDLEKERTAIVIGAHRLVHQIKSINPDAVPVYTPPEK